MIKKVRSLFDVFRRSMLRNPDASRKEQLTHFLDEVRKEPAYLDALAEDYFYRQAKDWQPEKLGPHSVTLSATPTAEHRYEKAAAKRAEGKKRVAAEVARIKNVLLMNLRLPTGSLLRDATGAECAKAGGFYTEVSRHLDGREVVGKHLDETDLQNIQARFVSTAKGRRRGTSADADHHASA